MAEKDAAYYRRLPYNRRVEPRQDGGQTYYVAWIAELPSIEIDGGSREEALTRLNDIFEDCIVAMLEAGDDIPEPWLWPAGLYGRAAKKNLKRIRKGTAEADAQAESWPPEHLPEEVDPWTVRHESSEHDRVMTG